MRWSWLPPLVLALLWGVGPALPALAQGDLVGHGFTDLYPSVWGLWWFAGQQPGLPAHTELLGFPEGMGFYYSSPLKGWLAWPLLRLLGVAPTWNLLLLSARVGTVLAAWAAARAWGAGNPGALAAAALYGCSPFFHGYAVEGIVEGTDGWTLALLALALGRRRTAWAAVALALTVLSSWYLGMVGCLVVVLAAFRDRASALALLGLLLAAPAIWSFAGAFPGASPLPAGVRALMGAHPTVPTPGLAPGLNPFAMNAYTGWIALAAAVWSRSRWVLLALIPAALSLGLGPVYDLPVAELVRFPYRWHAGTLLLLAPAVALTADRHRLWALGPLVALEGLLLGPIEPVLPGAAAGIPPIYRQVDAPLLVVPGPVALPPGEINRSRQRARYLLYAQTVHGQPSPWIPDFNAVGVTRSNPGLDALRGYDPVERSPATGWPALDREVLTGLARTGVVYLLVEGAELGAARSRALRDDLGAAGASLVDSDGERWLYTLPPPD